MVLWELVIELFSRCVWFEGIVLVTGYKERDCRICVVLLDVEDVRFDETVVILDWWRDSILKDFGLRSCSFEVVFEDENSFSGGEL